MRAAIFALPFLAMGLAGCDPALNTTTTSSAAVTQAQVFGGKIISVRQIQVNNNNDQIAGAVVGGLAGGLLGNQLGGGRGRDVTTTLGVLGGAAAGSQLARGANSRVTNEWTVRLDDGRTVSIVDDRGFRVGQRVNVVSDRNGVRLSA
jgi:outer membrane lipoprotein SlyB